MVKKIGLELNFSGLNILKPKLYLENHMIIVLPPLFIHLDGGKLRVDPAQTAFNHQ